MIFVAGVATAGKPGVLEPFDQPTCGVGVLGEHHHLPVAVWSDAMGGQAMVDHGRPFRHFQLRAQQGFQLVQHAADRFSLSLGIHRPDSLHPAFASVLCSFVVPVVAHRSGGVGAHLFGTPVEGPGQCMERRRCSFAVHETGQRAGLGREELPYESYCPVVEVLLLTV